MHGALHQNCADLKLKDLQSKITFILWPVYCIPLVPYTVPYRLHRNTIKSVRDSVRDKRNTIHWPLKSKVFHFKTTLKLVVSILSIT